MASITMTASFLGSSTITKHSSTNGGRRGLIIAKASRENEEEMANVIVVKNNYDKHEGSSNGRRELVFAAAAAAVCSISKVAMADEPKRGTPEAKKKYAPVCVTMPTARICRN